MNTLAIVLLFLACANASPFINSMREQWESFKTTYNKTYKDETEENYRMKIFVANMINIAQHNNRYARGKVTFELGVNRFSDMTTQEVVDTVTGLKVDVRKEPGTESGRRNYYTFDPNVTVPSSFDWREKGCVTPVKNQGFCGSCYAFSATGAMECRHKLKTGELMSLSEQNLVDCSQTYKNNGCHGGYMTNCYAYVKANKGISTEKAYPYKAVEEQCHNKPEYNGATIDSYTEIGFGDEAALMQAVATQGTISVGIDASHHSFLAYKSGVYYEPACSSKHNDLSHAVLVVGYGTENATDYWIVKNSWSAHWGENGYIRMSRDRDNNCGIASLASFPL